MSENHCFIHFIRSSILHREVNLAPVMPSWLEAEVLLRYSSQPIISFCKCSKTKIWNFPIVGCRTTYMSISSSSLIVLLKSFIPCCFFLDLLVTTMVVLKSSTVIAYLSASPYSSSSLFIEVKFTYHKTNHFKVHNSLAFRTVTTLCNHHLSRSKTF